MVRPKNTPEQAAAARRRKRARERERRRCVGGDGLTLGARMERIRRQDRAVREREAARRRERYRAKNGNAGATEPFLECVRENVFGASCSVCDRFTQDLVSLPAACHEVLQSSYPDNDVSSRCVLRVCARVRTGKIPNLAYPPIPEGLPQLDPVGKRLISPRMPFLVQIRRFMCGGGHDSTALKGALK